MKTCGDDNNKLIGPDEAWTIVKLTTIDPIMEVENAFQGDFMTGPVTALHTVGDNIVLAGTLKSVRPADLGVFQITLVFLVNHYRYSLYDVSLYIDK